MAVAALQSHWMRRRRKVFVMTPTETMVRSENKLPKHQQFGNTYDLMRVTAVILSANQEAEPETGETASVCSLSPFLLNAT